MWNIYLMKLPIQQLNMEFLPILSHLASALNTLLIPVHTLLSKEKLGDFKIWWNINRLFNPFHATGLFLYPLKTSGNQKFSSFLMSSGGTERDQCYKMDEGLLKWNMSLYVSPSMSSTNWSGSKLFFFFYQGKLQYLISNDVDMSLLVL